MVKKQHVFRCTAIFVVCTIFGHLLMANNFQGKCLTPLNSISKIVLESPKLSVKDSSIDGARISYTYAISILDDATLKTLNDIRNFHKPGASIGYEFYSLDVDQSGKTLKITLDNGVTTQSNLMDYLQKLLDNSIKN